ncbi:MAG: molybdopterin-synthase adenylyltransferase MoeB [Gemmatimonadaceae bacterium]|nr:molybdopterin-synthase adenylyltransferase MoeB [Gemmatimonadaceae bacterium]
MSRTEPLSTAERARYQRQLTLPEVGLEGQQRLKQARVLLVGAGGLGSPAALYLAAAGIGTIGLIDHDRVDASNLHRQLLHGTADVGRPKVDSARDRLRDVNPHVQIETHDAWLTSDNALALCAPYDLIVDGADTFATRYLVNDTCVLLDKPNVHGSVFRFDGQVSVFCTTNGPCYRCLYPEPPPADLVPSCAAGGVLGVLPGLIGTIQATETLKLLLGIGEPLIGRLLMLDALDMQPRVVPISRDPSCIACGTRTLTALVDYDAFCGTTSTIESITPDEVQEISPDELRRWLANRRDVQILDVREPHETALGVIEGARCIPLGTLANEHQALTPDHAVVCVCASGMRSKRAAQQLSDAGFSQVYSLTGGMQHWETTD